MSSTRVYLAGLISTEKPESLQWRVFAAKRLEQAGLKPISPMRGKEQLALESKDGGVSSTIRTPKDIMLRDYLDVEGSDVILMHLESFGSTRPLLGTIVELGWAWQLRKPLVAVAAADNYLMRNHPFVKEAVSHMFETLEEAVDYVTSYYKRP